MEFRQRKTLESARRVQLFFDDHPAVRPYAPCTLLERLYAAVDQVADHQLEQELALALGRCETVKHAAIRRDMYERFFCPIARAAAFSLRSVSEFRRLVVTARSLRAPHFRQKAVRFADAAEVHANLLISHGMPDDFIDQLRAALTQLSESAEAKACHRRRHTAATYAIRSTCKSVRQLVCLIDAVLASKVNRDPDLKASWVSSRRVVRK